MYKSKNNDIAKDFIENKLSRLDIKATTSNRQHINIKIQVKNEYNMIQRTLYYFKNINMINLNCNILVNLIKEDLL